MEQTLAYQNDKKNYFFTNVFAATTKMNVKMCQTGF